jgi:hypothetical protein
MSRNINEVRTNNTSGVPGLRLNQRKGHQVIDVTWRVGRKRSTSFPIGNAPLEAVARAMAKRAAEAGAKYTLTPRQAWERLKRGQGGSR